MTLASNTLQHQFMVNKLAKNPAEILCSLTPAKCHLLHMLTGIEDEYFELNIAKHNTDKENILEELGDLLFYTEGLLMGFEDELPNFKFCPLSRDETYQLLGRFVKRHVFYEQDLVVKDLICVYQNIKEWIRFDAAAISLTIVDVQNHNMAKLGKRYPNFDYTDTRAKERVDKTYKIICIDNATKEESIECKDLTKQEADDMIKKLNQAMPEEEPYTFKAIEQI